MISEVGYLLKIGFQSEEPQIKWSTATDIPTFVSKDSQSLQIYGKISRGDYLVPTLKTFNKNNGRIEFAYEFERFSVIYDDLKL